MSDGIEASTRAGWDPISEALRPLATKKILQVSDSQFSLWKEESLCALRARQARDIEWFLRRDATKDQPYFYCCIRPSSWVEDIYGHMTT